MIQPLSSSVNCLIKLLFTTWWNEFVQSIFSPGGIIYSPNKEKRKLVLEISGGRQSHRVKGKKDACTVFPLMTFLVPAVVRPWGN